MEKVNFNTNLSSHQWAILKAIEDIPLTDIKSDNDGCLEVELKINGKVVPFTKIINAMLDCIENIQSKEVERILCEKSAALSRVLERLEDTAKTLEYEFNARVSGIFDH